MNDPERYGVAEFDTNGNVISIEEKPTNPKSNFAIVGLYFYTNDVLQIAKKIKRVTVREFTKSKDKPQGTEDMGEVGEIYRNNLLNNEDKISNFSFDKSILYYLELYTEIKLYFKYLGLDIDSVLDENTGGAAVEQGTNMLGNMRKEGNDDDKDGIGGFFG